MKSPNLLPFDGEAYYFDSFLSTSEADAYFESFRTTIAWEEKPIRLFGRKVMQPRLTAWYGDKEAVYSYSGVKLKPLPWTPELLALKEKIESCIQANFNSVLLNLYRSGADSMGPHRDNERELGDGPLIASISLGQARTFDFCHRSKKAQRVRLEIQHGSLLLMKGRTQEFWNHALPKTKKLIGPRINLTFRLIK